MKNEMADRCTHCTDRRRVKPIAHETALDDPVGHLCLDCYSRWVSAVDHDAGCLTCGADPEYYTVREICDLERNPMLVEGHLGLCEEHIHEFATVGIRRGRSLR